MRSLPTISLLLALSVGPALADEIRLLVQSSPLAGSQYYALDSKRDDIRVGDALTLVREPDNQHDRWAIRVEWQGHKLGYVPRAENRAVAAAMDRGERVSARVSRLREATDPWRRVEMEIFVHI